MDYIQTDSVTDLEDAIAWHVSKILLMQDVEGMIPSYVTWVGSRVDRKKDVVRQSMATMGLMFAQALVPSLNIQKQIDASLLYVENNIELEAPIKQLSARLYLALGQAYANKDTRGAVELVLKHCTLPEFLGHPIAVGLYLRLSQFLPNALPHIAYLQETQRYRVSLTPRKGRFFDYADTMVWAKDAAPDLALQEYQYLETCYTSDGWFADPQTQGRVLSSVVGKFFEVLAYYGADRVLVERIYARLLQEKATSHYAKKTMGTYHEHILSQPNKLDIDDAHFHVLVGLCYLLAEKQKHI